MNISHKFIHWYHNEFKTDSLYTGMKRIIEDSPWHRERNVAVHTDMVVNTYMLTANAPEFTKNDVLGAFACAFHDVGKPAAAEINGTQYRPDRGHYLVFKGHELISARLAEDYLVTHYEKLKLEFGLTVDDIYTIVWMVEHHLPWAIKKPRKVNALVRTAVESGVAGKDSLVFVRALLADTAGRISDDMDTKLTDAKSWVGTFNEKACDMHVDLLKGNLPSDKKVAYVLIGASGCGKSTMAKYDSVRDEQVSVFSLDALRHEWYDETSYSNAFKLACEDKDFNAKAQDRYREMLTQTNIIYVDNTNTSAKSRAFYIQEARAKGFTVVGVYTPVALGQVRERQSSRPDKTVPWNAVDSQYMRTQVPQFGEFDWVITNSSNLPEVK